MVSRSTVGFCNYFYSLLHNCITMFCNKTFALIGWSVKCSHLLSSKFPNGTGSHAFWLTTIDCFKHLAIVGFHGTNNFKAPNLLNYCSLGTIHRHLNGGGCDSSLLPFTF